MRIAVRCLYHYPVTPNFLIINLDQSTWKQFLSADKYSRISIVIPFLPKDKGHPSIREIAWIPLGHLTQEDKITIILNILKDE